MTSSLKLWATFLAGLAIRAPPIPLGFGTASLGKSSPIARCDEWGRADAFNPYTSPWAWVGCQTFNPNSHPVAKPLASTSPLDGVMSLEDAEASYSVEGVTAHSHPQVMFTRFAFTGQRDSVTNPFY